MELSASSAIVTGGASGLGLASAKRLVERGAHVVLVDLPSSNGDAVAKELENATFAAADVTDPEAVRAAVDTAVRISPLRALVHCAGRGGPTRVVDKEGNPGSLEHFEQIIKINLIGSFNVLRLVAAAMAKNEPVENERGACVLTASVAAWEGQIGQIPYASSKGGVVAMTIVAARDLASRLIRVCTIAPGMFETPLLATVTDDVRKNLLAAVPHPKRFGHPEEFGRLAVDILENPMLNGETIRLDAAVRMPPR